MILEIPTGAELAVFAASYVLGSIPFAYLAVKVAKGVDIRTVGSGNVGATNAGRILGRPAAVGIYCLDAAKGAGSIAMARAVASGETTPQVVLCGILAVIGHCYPVWLNFRGGKGVATTTGVFLALEPMAFVIAGAAWIVTAAVTRYVSIASIALALAFPVAIFAVHGLDYCKTDWATPALAVIAALFIIIRHVPNLKRVAAGVEPKIFTKK